MTNVIERIRVQGISPTRESSLTSPSLPQAKSSKAQADSPWIPKGNGFSMTNQRQNKDFLSSAANPAARRAELLMRMRTANRGLSTMDSDFELSSIQFVLKGKPVQKKENKPFRPETSQTINNRIPPELPPRSYTQDMSVDRQIKVHIGKAHSEPIPSAEMGRGSRQAKVKDDNSLPPFSSPCFMLGPARPPPYGATPRRTVRSSGGFELTGHKMKGPESELLQSGFDDIYPHFHNSLRSHKRWTRNVPRESTPNIGNSDPKSLNRCLHVNQSIRLPLGTQEEAIKLKHFTQFVKKDTKTSHNNPYRKIKRKERRTLSKSDPQYQFNSVSSYIHFNRIYQQPVSERPLAVHIPPMSGFPSHCTDTVLLRMMLQMNQTSSKTPDSRYSDVAVHRDLDDYLMVRSPSGLSKTMSARSKKIGRFKSSKSGQSDHVAVDQWAGNVQREEVEEGKQEVEEEQQVEEEEGQESRLTLNLGGVAGDAEGNEVQDTVRSDEQGRELQEKVVIDGNCVLHDNRSDEGKLIRTGPEDAQETNQC